MKIVKTDILPTKHEFARNKEYHQIDKESICVFLALGFFLDEDTFYKDEKCLIPGNEYKFDDKGYITDRKSWYTWHYSPRDISFEKVLDQYQALLKTIIKEQISNNIVILPLSGGLDSRSQAMVLKDLANPVQAFSYSFKNGYPEHKIAQKIADKCNFQFDSYLIDKGYLWKELDALAEINGCFAEFTHPRQMAIFDQMQQMQGVFSLGHWGDVLFDRGAPESLKAHEILPYLKKLFVKPKGLLLASELWKVWGLEDNFDEYLTDRFNNIIDNIKIENISAKLRAIKTTQWAHRWTTTNAMVFKEAHPITMPYYDSRMIEFISSVPEEYLADRKLQIAHIMQDRELGNITWQDTRPFSIKNRHLSRLPYNYPYRVYNKINRKVNHLMGRNYIQRNWELQFVGKENEAQLKSHLYNSKFLEFVPKKVIDSFYHNFKNIDPVHYAHPISMLLTLSVWYRKQP